MFKFNFNLHSGEAVEISKLERDRGEAQKCIEHEVECHVHPEIQILQTEGLSHVSSGDALDKMEAKPDYLSQQSDLLKNVYEGGMKIWECSIDLVRYLNTIPKFEFENVLEIGCGAALPALFCLNKKSVKKLHLQDFNPEVIEHITKPNLKLNQVENEERQVRLFSGDWLDFSARMESEKQKYDLILTSETIYQEDNYHKLTRLFQHLLSEKGQILLAAKIHYFGVGGGLRTFEQTLSKWNYRTVFQNEDSVKREIIQIKWK